MSQTCRMTENLGAYLEVVDTAFKKLGDDNIIPRIWQHDHTVWKPSPTEIANRLGWLTIPEMMLENVEEINSVAGDIRSRGYTHALLMGMGGSSLAPEVLRKTFGVKDGYLDLAVLDSTDPAAVAAAASRLDPERTVYIVSTKSGTTTETLSFFKYFYTIVADTLGNDTAGSHFIAITDPATPLVDMADNYHFLKTFINEPTIGGRYSALSYFGLVPAALIGIDIRPFLERALIMVENCRSVSSCGARLGVVLGEMAKSGRDKATFVISRNFERFGDWVEQLIAESTGKGGRGIVPIVDEHIGFPGQYSADRLFVHLAINDDETYDDRIRDLEKEGHPVVHINLHDRYDLGGQFFLWEMAIAVAGHILGINPFDQPDVESAKVLSREAVDEYKEKGSLPVQTPVLCDMNTNVYGDLQAGSLQEALRTFLDTIRDDSYVAIQAYLQPTQETDASLQYLRMKIRDTYQVATTLGYGPRFLHSTGQLHKGDSGSGVFIQITSENPHDVAIPDEAGSDASSMSFGVLKTAQALGDAQALKVTGRNIIRLHLNTDDISGTIKRIAEILE
jgi:glucose-6-phosphate isomerase